MALSKQVIRSRNSSRNRRDLSNGITARVVSSLLAWFDAHARELPWRKTLDPYAIWVSEIMLQQTQVAAVIPYFGRWMKELCDVSALAGATEQQVLKLWEGLGYYSRVRNMQKAAQIIVEKHQGVFPNRFEDVFALPGIGRYTAGAITSIAFNQQNPVLDGNVIRVLCRLVGLKKDPRERTTNQHLWMLAQELVTQAAKLKCGATGVSNNSIRISGNCSRLNQALMELGALVCTPRNPTCEPCPATSLCRAKQLGQVAQIPNLGPRPETTKRRFVSFIISHNNRFLIQQRAGGTVNGGLWEFPNVECKEPIPLARLISNTFGVEPTAAEPFHTIQHSITRYRITLEAYRLHLKIRPRFATAESRWVAQGDLLRFPFPSAHRKLVELLVRAGR